MDTNVFDLDVGFQLATYDGSVAPTPWVELSVDFKPDMELVGVFVRAELHAVVAGWNPGIADWGELVTEVEVGLPADGEPVAVSTFLQLSIWFGG